MNDQHSALPNDDSSFLGILWWFSSISILFLFSKTLKDSLHRRYVYWFLATLLDFSLYELIQASKFCPYTRLVLLDINTPFLDIDKKYNIYYLNICLKL